MSEKDLIRRRKWYQKNKKRVSAYNKWWRENNKEQFRMLRKNALIKRKRCLAGSPGVTITEWDEKLREYNHRCAYCGVQGNMTMDHVVPLSKGGEHTIDNIVPACAPCNSSKCANIREPRIFGKVDLYN